MKRLLTNIPWPRRPNLLGVRSEIKRIFGYLSHGLSAAQRGASQGLALLGACARFAFSPRPRSPQRFERRWSIQMAFRHLGYAAFMASWALIKGLLLFAARMRRVRIPRLRRPTLSFRIRVPFGRFFSRLLMGDGVILGGLLVLAGLPRLMELDSIPFGPTEAYILSQAEMLVRSFALANLPDKAPLLAIFLAIPVAINRDPRWAAAFIALLHIGAIALFYTVLRRYWGRRLAILVGLLLATLPWAISPARSLAPEGLLLPLALLVLSALLSGIEGHNPWAWVVAPFAAGLAFFASPWGLVLPVILVVTALFYWRRIRWGYVALGCVLLAMAVGPYFDSLMRTKGSLASLWSLSSGESIPLEEGLSPFMALLAQEHALLESLGYLIYVLWGASLVLSAWGAFYVWSHWQVGQPISRYLVSAIWNGAMLLLAMLKPIPLVPREMAALFVPGGVLGLALVLDLSALFPQVRRAVRRWRWAAWMRFAPWAVCLLFVLWGLYAIGLVDIAAMEGHPVGSSKTYRAWRGVQEALLREARVAQGDQVWIVEPASSAPWEAEGQPLRYLLSQEMGVATLHQKPGAVLLPAERPGIYALFGEAPWVERLIAYFGQSAASKMLGTPEDPGPLLSVLPGRTAEEMLALIPKRTAYSFDAGAHLVGYQWPQAHSGEIIALATYWTFWDIPPREQALSHRLILSLTDAQGHSFAQTEGLGLEARDWQEGLLLEQWHLLDLTAVPPGAYALVVRLARGDGTPCLYVSETGTPLGSGVALGPVTVLPRIKP